VTNYTPTQVKVFGFLYAFEAFLVVLVYISSIYSGYKAYEMFDGFMVWLMIPVFAIGVIVILNSMIDKVVNGVANFIGLFVNIDPIKEYLYQKQRQK